MAITTWDAFKSIPNGTRIFNGGDECVAVANEYHLGVLGGSWVAIWSAYEWWTRYSELPALNTMYKKSQTPVAGAVVVWNSSVGGGHGHIGVVLSVNANGSFVVLDQNWQFTGPERWAYRHTWTKQASILGFLVPNNNPATPTTPPAETHQGNGSEMFMIYRANAAGSEGHHFAIVGPNFWLDFTGQGSASNINKQLAGTNDAPALAVTQAFWDRCKAAAGK